MSFSNVSRRLFAAVALAAVFLVFFMAGPAEAAGSRAAGGREWEPGIFGWLISWIEGIERIVGIEMAGTTGGSGGHDGPYVDPNGRPGAPVPPPAPVNPQGGS